MAFLPSGPRKAKGEGGYQPNVSEDERATIVASDSIMNRGVFTSNLPQVIFFVGYGARNRP